MKACDIQGIQTHFPVASETSNIHVGKLEGSVEEWQMADPVDGESVLQDHHGRQGKVSSFRIGAHHTGQRAAEVVNRIPRLKSTYRHIPR